MSDYFMQLFSSTGGRAGVTVVLLAVLLIFAVHLQKSKTLSVKSMTYTAIALTLAIVLSNFKLFHMPFGGSITPFSMLFVVLIGYWFGAIPGVLGGVTYGLLQLIIAPYVIHPAQLLLDYPLAFGALGVSGFFCNKPNGLIKGYAVGVLGRWVFSSLSGCIFFASYAPENMNPIIYSVLYNGFYMGGEAVLTIGLLLVPSFKRAIEQIKNALHV